MLAPLIQHYYTSSKDDFTNNIAALSQVSNEGWGQIVFQYLHWWATDATHTVCFQGKPSIPGSTGERGPHGEPVGVTSCHVVVSGDYKQMMVIILNQRLTLEWNMMVVIIAETF